MTMDKIFRGYGRLKSPMKIKIFMWMVAQKTILTKDNGGKKLARGPGCYFYEYIYHLLFHCPVAKVIWGTLTICFHQNNRASSYEQFWPWIRKAIPRGSVYAWSCSILLGNLGCQEQKVF
jgi:hypothetical protein